MWPTPSTISCRIEERQRAAATPEKSIAVLPFANLSAEKANAYFADGIQDEILTRLSTIADLKVISRTSTQHYGSTPQNLPEIARQLDVANILEGSVQRSTDAVRVNVQLIQAASDSHLWADTFDRKLTDMFAVESEIATSVASKLQAKLTGAETFAIRCVRLRIARARLLSQGPLLLEQTRRRRNGIANVYILLPLYGGDTPGDAFPKSRAAANKAIALDPTLGEPHATLGNIYCVTFDFPTSIREFERGHRAQS